MRSLTLLVTACGICLVMSSSAFAQMGAGGTGTSGGGGGSNQNLPTLTLGGFSTDNSNSAFGANDTPGAASNTASQQTTTGRGGNAFGGAFGGQGGAGNFFSQLFGGANTTTSSRRTLRAPLRADFEVIRPASNEVATVLNNRLAHIGSLRNLEQPIEVQVVDRVATLRGRVDSESQKELAARMASLEPGVSSVVNEIVVADQ